MGLTMELRKLKEQVSWNIAEAVMRLVRYRRSHGSLTGCQSTGRHDSKIESKQQGISTCSLRSRFANESRSKPVPPLALYRSRIARFLPLAARRPDLQTANPAGRSCPDEYPARNGRNHHARLYRHETLARCNAPAKAGAYCFGAEKPRIPQ